MEPVPAQTADDPGGLIASYRAKQAQGVPSSERDPGGLIASYYAKGGKPGDIDLRDPGFTAQEPPEMPRRIVAPSRPAVPSVAPDASRVGPPPGSEGHHLTGAAKLASDVFQTGASSLEHPIGTAAGIATAPIHAAFTIGRYAGQPIARAIEPDAVREYKAGGGKEVTGKDAAIAGAQLATMAAAPVVARGVSRLLTPVVGETASGIAGAAAAGAPAGAAFMPDKPGVGAIIGALAGGVHGATAAAEHTQPSPSHDAPSTATETSPTNDAATVTASTPKPTPAEQAVAEAEIRKRARFFGHDEHAAVQLYRDDLANSAATHAPPVEQASASSAPTPAAAPLEAASPAATPDTPALATVGGDGLEERNLGVSLSPAMRAKLASANTALSQAVTDPNAPIVAEHPAIARAIASANAMTPTQAGTFARQMAERAVSDLTPEQRAQFGARLTLDQLDAEIARKGAAAAALSRGADGPPAEGSDVHQQLADLQGTVRRLTVAADQVRQQTPDGIEQQPWFQKALKAHVETVQPFLERAATEAGVSPESFRQPSLGAYTRLIPAERITEPLIRRSQSIAAGEGEGATTPREGLTRTLLGQKRGVVMSSPIGTEAPMQGPVDLQRETPAGGAVSVTGTKVSGSANRVTGGRDYSTDYLSNIQYDAADKVSKAAHNQIFTAIAQDAAKNPTGDIGKVFELAADKNAPPGMKVVAFNDSKQLVDPPPADDAMSSSVRRFAVPKDVGDAIDRYRAKYTYPSAAGRAVRSGLGAVTKSVLLNPVVAGTHTLTLASSVGTGVPADAVMSGAATAAPGVKTISTIKRMRAVDFNDPAVAQRLTRLAFNGALRIGEDRGGGLLDAGHHFLFGPEGMDTRARVVASQDIEAGLRKAGITPDDPRFAGLERKYVVEHTGNYVSRNQGIAAKWLQENGIAPFIAINRAKLGTSLKALVGSDGTIAPDAARRLGIMARGPLGTAASIAAAGYLLSGHKPSENAEGHEGDLATGVYQTPDGAYRYYRGDPKEAVATFGKGTKEVYLRRGFVDPASEAALRVLQPLVVAHSGDRLHETLRAAVNTGLGFAGPGIGVAFGLTTGKSLYLDPQGNFASVDEKSLPGQQDATLTGRLVAASRNANAAASLALPPQGDQSKNTLGRPFLNAFAVGNPIGREGAERAQVNDWIDDRRLKILREPDRAARERLMAEALQDAEHAGYAGPAVRQQLQKAVNQGGRDRTAVSQRKFDNRVRSQAPAPTPPIRPILRPQ